MDSWEVKKFLRSQIQCIRRSEGGGEMTEKELAAKAIRGMGFSLHHHSKTTLHYHRTNFRNNHQIPLEILYDKEKYAFT